MYVDILDVSCDFVEIASFQVHYSSDLLYEVNTNCTVVQVFNHIEIN